MEMIEISVKVPKGPAERMQALAEASGVTLDAFVSASLEIREAEHEGRTTLNDALLDRARKYV